VREEEEEHDDALEEERAKKAVDAARSNVCFFLKLLQVRMVSVVIYFRKC
jgi:hypothetical protein